MSRAWVLLVTVGCATGGEDGPVVDASIDTRAADSAVDTYVPPTFDGPMEAIFPTDDTAPPKICDTPAGTTLTVSGSYMSTPEMALDKNLGTVWNAGDHTGWMELRFPAPIWFDRVRIAAHALPACNVTYRISATGPIGEGTRLVPTDTVWLDAIPVTAGSYASIRIDVPRADSWITLGEVRVLDSTGGCP